MQWKKILVALLLVKALAVLLLIQFGFVGLAPDEAQYWLWSKNLDWGYYSKPPGIAWEIGLGRLLFGDTELGVRFFAVVISTLQGFATYYLAKKCGLSERKSVLAALILSFSPLGVWGALLATTDGGMILFWTLALAVLVSSTPVDGIKLGACILGGALFKWTIFLFWPLVLLFRLPVKNLLKGVLLSLLALLPSVIWNVRHDFSTFRHVFTQASSVSLSGNFWEFFGAQAILFSPLFFLAFLFGSFRLKKLPEATQVCGRISLLILAGFSALALFKKIQGNWAVAFFPGAAIVIAEVVNSRRLLAAGFATSGCLIFALFLMPFSKSPFRHQVGWEHLAVALEEVGFDPELDFLFSDKYQTSCIASFYSKGQKRSYFLNLKGARENQFCYWPTLADEQIGSDGYFLFVETSPHFGQDFDKRISDYEKMLSPFFDQVELKEVRELVPDHKIVVIYKGFNYNGAHLQAGESDGSKHW